MAQLDVELSLDAQKEGNVKPIDNSDHRSALKKFDDFAKDMNLTTKQENPEPSKPLQSNDALATPTTAPTQQTIQSTKPHEATKQAEPKTAEPPKQAKKRNTHER